MTKEQEVTVCIAIYKHRHGEDMSVHRTIAGAEAHLRETATENLEEWGEDPAQYSGTDNDVWRNWHNIAGMSESMTIEVLTLND